MTFRLKYLNAFAGCIFSLWATQAEAALVSVDWTPDGTADGVAGGVFTSTGTVAANSTATNITLTSTLGGINGGSTFVPGGLNYVNSDFAGSLPGIRDGNNQPFTDAFGQPLIRNEIGTFDWLNGEAGFLDLDFGGKFLRDPILVFSFINGLIGYDFDDNTPIQILGQPNNGGAAVGPGNVVSGPGFSGGPNGSLSIGLTGVFDSIQLVTNAFEGASSANGLTVFVEESNILTEAPAAPSVVPVPAALPLFLTALAAIGLVKRQKRMS